MADYLFTGIDLDGQVIAGLILEKKVTPEIRSLLSEKLFKQKWRFIAAALLSVADRLGICDLAAVLEELDRIGGGIQDHQLLFDALERVPTPGLLETHLKLLCERATDGTPTGESRWVEQILATSGLSTLQAPVAPDALEGSLRALAAALNGADPLRLAAVREAAFRCLEKAGVKTPARLIDAALETGGGSPDAHIQGQELLFTDPVPWPHPVNGAALLTEVEGILTKYVVLPPHGATAAALWTANTHAHEAADISPILALKSAEKRCGKTKMVTIVRALVPRPLLTANITPAALFRIINEYQPSVLVDEADAFLGLSDELRGLLNAGHTFETAWVLRCVGEDYEVRRFCTWCPKAVALIGKLPDTLADRSIEIPMVRRKKDEAIARLRQKHLAKEAEPVFQKLARWTRDHLPALCEADPEVPEALDDRAADNWRPLLAIADCCGGEWPEKARRAALTLSGAVKEDDGSPGIQLLTDLRSLFREWQMEKLGTEEILAALTAMADRPWPEWRRGKPLSAYQLARLLNNFKVKPKKIRIGDGTKQGYHLADLQDAFSRYLLPSEPEHPEQTNEDNKLGDFQVQNTGVSVLDGEGT